jgi:ferredoxin-NADP reductase
MSMWSKIRATSPSLPPARRAAATAAGAGVAAIGSTVLELKRRKAHSGRGLAPDAELIRSVLARMTTPLLPDDYLHMVNPLWTARELRGKIVEIAPETDDAATLVIQPGWGWSASYSPGQYVGIGVNVDGRWHWRSYSISSAPAAAEVDSKGRSRRDRNLTITVKAMPEGFLSAHLVRGLEPGTVVRLALPQGEFVLPDPPPPKILFWTGGSGITPIMCMLRTLDRRGTMPDVVHIHSAPNRDSAIFRQERTELAELHASLRLVENFDDEHGRFAIDRLDTECPDWREREAWVCGPAGMLEDAERRWEREQVARRLHLERFSTKLSASAEGGHVVFAKSGKEADLDGATTLLEAGEKAGVAMPFGCRMGICHTCIVPLKKGTVKDLRDGTEFDENRGVQTCVTAAAGDCILDV